MYFYRSCSISRKTTKFKFSGKDWEQLLIKGQHPHFKWRQFWVKTWSISVVHTVRNRKSIFQTVHLKVKSLSEEIWSILYWKHSSQIFQRQALCIQGHLLVNEHSWLKKSRFCRSDNFPMNPSLIMVHILSNTVQLKTKTWWKTVSEKYT